MTALHRLTPCVAGVPANCGNCHLGVQKAVHSAHHIVYQDLLLGSSLFPAGVLVSPLVASLLPCFILFISLLLFIYVCLSEWAFIVFVLFCFASWASISPKLGKMANFPLRSCGL